MYPQLAARTYEVHPEVSFTAWGGQHMAHHKRTSLGKQERQMLIARQFGPNVFSGLRADSAVRLPEDDVADAFAALWSADRIRRGVASRLPDHTVLDASGFPMNIWY